MSRRSITSPRLCHHNEVLSTCQEAAKVPNKCVAKLSICGFLGVALAANGLSVRALVQKALRFVCCWFFLETCGFVTSAAIHSLGYNMLLYCLILSRVEVNCFWQQNTNIFLGHKSEGLYFLRVMSTLPPPVTMPICPAFLLVICDFYQGFIWTIHAKPPYALWQHKKTPLWTFLLFSHKMSSENRLHRISLHHVFQAVTALVKTSRQFTHWESLPRHVFFCPCGHHGTSIWMVLKWCWKTPDFVQ